MRKEFVVIVEKFLKSINIVKHFVVQNLVQQNIDGKIDVYNITVVDKHEYFANSLLVSNCDSIRYALYTHLGNRPEYSLIIPGETNEYT